MTRHVPSERRSRPRRHPASAEQLLAKCKLPLTLPRSLINGPQLHLTSVASEISMTNAMVFPFRSGPIPANTKRATAHRSRKYPSQF
ncbi:hypothetical protein PUN28_010926 [Cardiocondyla obscurior]|uniref:Uncharacterized protein n=1 Tax=Cardiocondyla obscurior TaxID=286306 RepID=A0AAW2FMW2_9HYME